MENKTKRTITDVLNVENGQCIDANVFFKKPLDELTVYRSELQKAINGFRDPLFKCYYCKQLIRIRGGKSVQNKRKAEIFHFAHLKDSDDCHIKTNNQFTKEEVDRIKYNGAKESILHQNIKENIAECLSRNQHNNKGISQIEVERVISDKVDKEWKKPDINAYFLTKRIAIELQLSTTWLDVITRRQHFYKEQGIYIFWIFNEFNLNDDVRKLTFNDVIYTNNQNAYVFDDEMYEQSITENDLILKCYYKTYCKNRYNEIEEEWEDSVIRLSDLTFDEKNFRIFYHDAEKQKSEVEQEILSQKRINEIAHRKHVKRMNEEKQIKEKHDLELKEKKGSLEIIIQDLNSEIRGIKTLQEEYLVKKSNVTKTLTEKVEIVKNISGYTNKTVKHLSDNRNNYKPFYDNDSFLDALKSEFGERLALANGIISNLNQEQDKLSSRQFATQSLPVITISNTKFSIIDKSIYWDYIEQNYSLIKIIHKNLVNDLFAFDEIKTIQSSSELFQFKVSNNYLFLMDFTLRVEEIKEKHAKNNIAIFDQQKIIATIHEEIKKKLETHLQNEIKELEAKLGTYEIIENRNLIELEQKEGELTTQLHDLYKINAEI